MSPEKSRAVGNMHVFVAFQIHHLVEITRYQKHD